MVLLVLFYGYRYSAAFSRGFAVLLPDSSRGVQVFKGKAFLDEGFHYTSEAMLGEQLVVPFCTGRTGFCHKGEFLPLDAACEGFQPVGFGTAHIGAVVVELHEVRWLDGCCHRRLAVLAVLKAVLKVL